MSTEEVRVDIGIGAMEDPPVAVETKRTKTSRPSKQVKEFSATRSFFSSPTFGVCCFTCMAPERWARETGCGERQENKNYNGFEYYFQWSTSTA